MGDTLRVLPVLPELSRRSGAMKAMRGKGLRRVATVATTFINLNKKKGYRKTFRIRVATLATDKINYHHHQ